MSDGWAKLQQKAEVITFMLKEWPWMTEEVREWMNNELGRVRHQLGEIKKTRMSK